ncbi:hypothetical protein H6P81_001068 [Aristolochia fimbriata]|uniref:Uncharacterized protein n=1 Tax=Aristolochia fimbriata TaxID=158543 RepID=A0AAV7F5V2_ARIFI|nr:hypothetical protein H6P81_001068 [Aristolochia fimbriata]
MWDIQIKDPERKLHDAMTVTFYLKKLWRRTRNRIFNYGSSERLKAWTIIVAVPVCQARPIRGGGAPTVPRRLRAHQQRRSLSTSIHPTPYRPFASRVHASPARNFGIFRPSEARKWATD